MNRTETSGPPPARISHADAHARDGNIEHDAALGHAHSSPVRAILIGTAALIVLVLLMLFGYGAAHEGRAYRGVQVLGTDLGGKNRSEAEAALATLAAGYPTGQLAVSTGSKTWTFSPADLGVALDTGRTADSALMVGRGGNTLEDTGVRLGALLSGSRVQPVLKHNDALVDKAVATIAAELDRPAVDSKLEQGADGIVQITPSSAGSVVDRSALRAAILSSVASAPFDPVTVSMVDQSPAVTEAVLEASRAEAMLVTEQPISLTAGEEAWTLKPEELREMLALKPTSDPGKWSASLDNNTLAEYLAPIADDIRIEPQDATVVIGKGTVTLKEEKAGAELQVVDAIALIQSAATKSAPGERNVELPVKVVPATVHTDQVKAVYEKANSLVTEGIRLHFRDDGYILRGSSVTGFIDVAPAQGGPGPLKLVIDSDVLSSRISGVAFNFNRPSSDARFRMVNGKPTRISAGKDGYKVDVAKSLDNAEKAIEAYSGGERLQVGLEVAITEPSVKDADLSTIRTPDLLGTGQTSYAGSSAERAWNVGLGTRNVDGALIPPGGIFSTVDAVGDLTLEAGYKMGYMIINNGEGITTVPAEAGGICQVSTTLFHSVFWAGLQIEERNWHSYWIGTYGRAPSGLPGLDATIAPPEKDFRFRNNTGNWIHIRATADGKNVTFSLYGVKPGWTVNVGKPVITNTVKTDTTPITEYSDKLPAGKKVLVEHAQDGFSSSITRVVTDSSGKVIDTWTAKSRYAPAHERYLIGTGK